MYITRKQGSTKLILACVTTSGKGERFCLYLLKQKLTFIYLPSPEKSNQTEELCQNAAALYF